MDDDFLEELDRRVSNVSLDRYWERRVGDLVLWLSPVDYVHQIRIKETLQQEGNPNVIDETKRMTLAGAIVGIGPAPAEGEKPDVFDFRDKRGGGKVFKVQGKGGKDELVDLSEYLYRKIARWDAEFIFAAFDVYSDAMESHRRELVKDVVFENLKDPREELAELEEKAAELRQGLGLPPLVEAKRLDGSPSADEADLPEAAPDEAAEPPPEDAPPGSPPSRDPVEDFDPFAAVDQAEPPPPPPPAAPAPPPRMPDAEPTFAVPVPPPATSSPRSPIERELARRTPSARRATVLTPPEPGKVVHMAQPSVPEAVLDQPAERAVVPVPKVDRGTEGQNLNPRFARPR